MAAAFTYTIDFLDALLINLQEMRQKENIERAIELISRRPEKSITMIRRVTITLFISLLGQRGMFLSHLFIKEVARYLVLQKFHFAR